MLRFNLFSFNIFSSIIWALQIYVSKMRSELKDFELHHERSSNLRRMYSNNKIEFDTELTEISEQLKTAKEDRELTLCNVTYI